MQIYLNGRLAPPEDTRIAPGDRGFTLADGLFETLLVRDGGIVLLDAHLDRLTAGLDLLGFAGTPDRAALAAACEAARAANAMALGVLRLTVTRGEGVRGLAPPDAPRPTVLVTAAPYAPPPPDATAAIARSTARNERSPLSRCKALAYQDNILALMEARAAGADDALMLNTQGRLACSSVGNVVIRRGDALLTPRLDEGPLSGTVRAAAIAALGIADAALTPEELAGCDEIVLVNSLGVRRVTALDGRPLKGSRTLFDALAALHESLA